MQKYNCCVLFRAFRVNLLQEEGPGWWPDDLLKEHYSLGEYEDSTLERLLLVMYDLDMPGKVTFVKK